MNGLLEGKKILVMGVANKRSIAWGCAQVMAQQGVAYLDDGTMIVVEDGKFFRPCSTCRSRSQAPFCLYTLRMISNHSEGTFGRLRYLLGGDRPSQTAHLTLSPAVFAGAG